jgi:hypothetical protein
MHLVLCRNDDIFEVLTAVIVKSFWDMAMYSRVKAHRLFSRKNCLQMTQLCCCSLECLHTILVYSTLKMEKVRCSGT